MKTLYLDLPMGAAGDMLSAALYELLSDDEKMFERKNKLLRGMKLREYNAFLVNNRDRLVEIFSKVSEEQLGEIEETELLKKEWNIPKLYQL